jgi:hypothetical protein
MNARMQTTLAFPTQMLGLTVPDSESRRDASRPTSP